MKLKPDEISEIPDLLAHLTEQDQIVPYATLLAFEVPARNLQRIAEHFQMDLCSFSGFQVFKMKNPKSGEHKLQCLDLLAVAICIHKNFPFARLSLNVHHDFMLENRHLESELLKEGEQTPEGCLQVFPCCQLYLSQAGFDFSIDESSCRYLKAGEVLELAETFYSSSRTPVLVRGA